MIYIKNAKIKTMAGKEIEKGNILIKEGKIAEISEKEIDHKDATVIDAKGMLTTPGLIDCHTHLGIANSYMRWEGMDYNEYSDPVTPHMRAIDGINPMDDTIEAARKAGVTTVGTGPGSANVIGGTYATIKTYGKRIDDMVINSAMGMKIAFGENPKNVFGNSKKMPITRMGVAGLLRETLFKAKNYNEELLKHEENPKENQRPPFDIKLEAMLPVIRKEIPLKAHAHRADDIFTAIRIANEFGLKITLDHCSEGHLIADDLAKEGKPCIVGPTFSHASKPELRNKSFSTVKILLEKGLQVAICTDSPVIPLDGLPMCAGMCIKAGAEEEKVWEAITINPARIMGVDNRIGSIEVGKDADIVIHKSNPLHDIQSTPAFVIINGEVVVEN